VARGRKTTRTRAVAYIRESTEEQGQGFSPDAQREAIRKFCAENDLQLVGEYCDFHSGWKKAEGRPHFRRLMADAADCRFDVVLVYHTSRFARNQVEARSYKQMLRQRLGIKVISVTQPLGDDPSDPSPPCRLRSLYAAIRLFPAVPPHRREGVRQPRARLAFRGEP
jgi:DNA invertase Pin-like site-specific DNA recombinase